MQSHAVSHASDWTKTAPGRIAHPLDTFYGPAAALGVEPGTTRTFSLVACGVRFAGTRDRCPERVRRSIGQRAAQCQKQNGTFRGVSGAYHTRVAQHARVPHPSGGVILFSNIPIAGSAPQMTAGDRR